MLFSLFENVLDSYTSRSRQIVLAFSGGIDSRVLLDLLSNYRDTHSNHRYLVIHVDHGLSKESDQWMQQCEELVEDIGFPFKGVNVSVERYGNSIEEVARDARYKALLDNTEVNALIVTGQHADDQAETFLLALKRGSGPAGLSAMPLIRPLGHAELLRPLLSVTRKEIERYAYDERLSWIDDESNLDCRFDRNFIRHSWLPSAQTRWPGLTKSINRSAVLCAEQEQLLEELLSEHYSKVMLESNVLSLSALNGCSKSIQVALVRRWLKQTSNISVSKAQLQEVFSSVITASSDANPKLQLGSWKVVRFQKCLYVIPDCQDITEWHSRLEMGTSLQLPDGVGELCLMFGGKSRWSLRTPMENEPVWVRFNPEGISANPIGRQGKRKLKKLYQEYGIPSWSRRRTPLVFYGEHLAAVAELFVCKGYEGQECDLVWYKHHVLSA
ncbi:tRNA lysidine(34) synthetase TilS [Candidatus Enterovibrio escicola]|uniref:tRNA(Ile)-lysidine synthase n=1 Tax=Candidatus Enterovibrio escicola TaxID=1927127 RepID=A0A2A5T0R7_9GAMM|nr:tRNA lysidine(34) synthetase TilS [Candidatus Enterovibrio escacola]PCS21754.1 tRNA(Ile)-lysidine synthetase [Candidatus Enterovibrio escacola]